MKPKSAKGPLRAVIYARYSTDKQRSESIDDQARQCEAYAQRLGWVIVGQYDDPETSGEFTIRPEYERMQRDAEAGKFDVLIGDTIARLDRTPSSLNGLYERFRFLGIAIHTAAQGEMDTIKLGIYAAINASYIETVRYETRRSQAGKVANGMAAGGLGYGYRAVPGKPGERTIDPDEAKIVMRIFQEFAAGRSPFDIAAGLNADKIRPPAHAFARTKSGPVEWGDTAIRGQQKRGTGILNNLAYIGQLAWNRCTYVKIPDGPNKGQRQARPLPSEEWTIVDAPHLRIIDDELWHAVKRRQATVNHAMDGKGETKGHALARANRKHYLLSGLLICGECGSPFIMTDYYRYGCNRNRGKGTCTNSIKIKRTDIEARVIEALRTRLLEPAVMDIGLARLRDKVAQLAATSDEASEAARRKLAAVERKISGMFRAIEDGMYTPSMKERMLALEAEKAMAEAELAEADLPPPEVPDPSVVRELYMMFVDCLTTLVDGEEYPAGAFNTVRAAIKEIRLTPVDGALEASMVGNFTGLLQALENKQPASSETGCSMAVVAGRGFEPLTFRL